MRPSQLTSTLSSHLLRGLIGLQVGATTRLERGLMLLGGTFGGLMALGGSAYAAGSGCSSSAATSLQTFIGDAANFAIGIGAGGALLMVAVGALFIIFGHTPQRASMGMKIIKNAVIGLAVLAAGLFLKFIVLDVVIGASGSNGPGSSTVNCLKTGGGNI